MYLETRWFGTFLLDDELKIGDQRLFPRESLRGKLKEILAGEILDEELELAREGEVKVRDRRLLKLRNSKLEPFQIEIHGEDYGYDQKLLREAMVSLAQEKIEGFAEMELIGDVHFLEQLESFRAKVGTKDAKLSQEVERAITSTKEGIERWMGEKAPNLKEVLGGILGAKMIAEAGSLEKLAKMNMGTIQTIGSEKSLFKHPSRPPKHGLLYQHPSVRTSKAKERGKASKKLAKEVALACRRDFFL
jgi:hypothetical protein